MNLPFRVKCINDSNRPNDIPTSKWVKKGEWYTVIKIDKLMIQGGRIGFKLEELNIDDCFPYQYFDPGRFAIPVDLSEQSVEEMLESVLEEAKQESLTSTIS